MGQCVKIWTVDVDWTHAGISLRGFFIFKGDTEFMKLKTPKTKAELLLIATVAFGLSACGGSKGGGTAAVITDDVTLELPEDRAAIAPAGQGNGDSLYGVGTDTSGKDVEASKSTALGARLMSQLNTTKAADVENGALEDIVQELLEKDLANAKIKFEAAKRNSIALRDGRIKEVDQKFGAETLTQIVGGTQFLIERKQKEIDSIVAAINAYDQEFIDLSNARRGRANEVKALEDKIKVLEKELLAVEASTEQKAEMQKSALLLEIELIDQQIAGLDQQAKILEADFKKAFDVKRKEFSNVNVFGKQLIGKSDAEIRKEVIDADPVLKDLLAGAKVFRDEIEVLKASKLKKKGEMTTADIMKLRSAPELKTALAEARTELAKFSKIEKKGVIGFREEITIKFYRYNNAMISESDLSQKLLTSSSARMAKLEDLRKMDPEALKREGTENTSALVAKGAQRSAEFYRDAIKKAFADRLKKWEELQKARAEQESALQSDLSAAQKEMQRVEAELKSVSGRISKALKSVAACQDSVSDSSKVSKRVIVDTISADLERNLVTTLGTFEDFTRVEGEEEGSEFVTTRYENTNDFGRFVYLMLNDKEEVIGFKTASELQATQVTRKGTGVETVEVAPVVDAEGNEIPQEPKKVVGDKEYSVNFFKADFSTPVSSLEGNSFSVALCVENKKGEMELKTRKIIVRNKAPVSPSESVEVEQ